MAALSGGRPSAAGSRIAVLGASGCVGRCVSAALAREGHEVLAVARRGGPSVADHVFAGLDVAAVPPAELARLLTRHRVRAVVNVTGGWGTTEEEMQYAHITLVERLLSALTQMAERPRLVHVGSIHEYGPVPEPRSIGEDLEPRPTTMYARTKLAGSELVLDGTRAGRVDGLVLRAVNVCGPRTTRASFLGSVVDRLRAASVSAPVTLRVADARRDFIDVRDLAEAVVLAVASPATARVVNIGRGEASAMRELVDLLVAASGLPPEALRVEDGPVASKGGGWTLADIRLAGELLGWKPRIALAEAMRATWETPAD
ncbi:NAD-dependent epimerase/dehydratase family protein [Streptomyces griseoruber]|uniref:NAD-dependent epimerase/dehydratase family protein n=1 Tax=Streptomyces griseoruber TaxID=1943 RepID=UPI000ADAD2EF|nr:NAD(P)-dependent oxidoreductase [Streptomyces griseoruber]